jgi:putative transposase
MPPKGGSASLGCGPRLGSTRGFLKALVNAVAYWLRAGCAWRLLPHDLSPWQTVYHYLRCWRQQGLGEQIHHRLHVAERIRPGLPPSVILNSQSVKTTKRAATRLRRRQAAQRPQAPPAGRHPRPDLQGAGDRRRRRRPRRRHGAAEAIRPPAIPRLRHGWVDGGYRGPLLDWAHQRRGISFQVVSRSDGGRTLRWLPPGATPPGVPVPGGSPLGGGADFRLAGSLRSLE